MSEQQGSNSAALTDDHRRALAYHHKGKYESSLAKKKKADAELKNTAKRAIAEGVSMDTIKALIKLDTPEGEQEIREQMNLLLQAAGWSDSEIGTQFSFEDIPDRSPLIERAAREGKTAGMKGVERVAPFEGEAGEVWLDNYTQGQAILMETLTLTSKGMRDIEAEQATKAAAKAEKKAAKEAGAPTKKPRGRPKGSGKGKKANGSTQPLPGQTDVEDAPTGQPEGGEEQSAA